MLQDVASHAIPEVNSSGYQLDLSEVMPALGQVSTITDVTRAYMYNRHEIEATVSHLD